MEFEPGVLKARIAAMNELKDTEMFQKSGPSVQQAMIAEKAGEILKVKLTEAVEADASAQEEDAAEGVEPEHTEHTEEQE